VQAIRARVVRGLALALIVTGLLAAATVLGRLAAGDNPARALRSASALEFRKLLGPAGMDSWAAMFAASHRLGLGGALYADVLLLDNCKYQYPPAALLLMEALPHPAGQYVCSSDADLSAALEPRVWRFKPWIDLGSRLAWLATLWMTAVLMLRALVPARPMADAKAHGSILGRAALYGLVGALGLAFYPLVWGHVVGQIQVYLNLLMVAALWAVLAGRGLLAGVLIGLCCLFKPQYVVLLAWALLRREWRIGSGLAAVAAAGTGLALWRYGAAVHLEYIDFLRGLSRLGESYWANQSFNGLVHRWIEPSLGLQWADAGFASSADAMLPSPAFDWASAGFPAYHASVHAVTIATSLAILAVALWPVRAASTRLHRVLDLGVATAACTVASPVAWWHHYGAFFALFALALVALASGPARGRRVLAAALLLAYALLGSAMLRPELVFDGRLTALLGSHGLLGALLLIAVLLALRTRASSGHLDPADASPLDIARATDAKPEAVPT
jgi:hypothetical protein